MDRIVRRIGSSASLANGSKQWNPEKLLPKDVLAAVRQSTESSSNTDSNPSTHEVLVEQLRDVDIEEESDTDEQFDLQPPPIQAKDDGAFYNKKLFSVEHLQLIVLDRTFCDRFSSFLQHYKPEYSPVLARYQSTLKARKAVEYANAVSQGLPYLNRESVGDAFTPAATFDDTFQSRSDSAEKDLVEGALPAWITYRLLSIATSCLVKEITGENIPLMQSMVQGLGEVYCLSDPSITDNPIIYASELFYETTQYGLDYAIGRNCRFLNGPATLPASRSRVGDAIREGREVCETILNYRRDGTPFLNLLMVAPLYDNKGRIRYFIGCQIDVTNLVKDGRGLDSLQRLLAREQSDRRFGDLVKQKSSLALGDLGHLLDAEEMHVLKTSMAEISSDSPSPSIHLRHNAGRRHIGTEQIEDRDLWPLRHLGPSLPGVYQNFLLIRPYPSLRICFTSASLRIPGMAQSRFMTRIGGPEHVREGIAEALQEGVSVTAKVLWLTNASSTQDGSSKPVGGKLRWVHCTPLLDSTNSVGVWMCILVEQEKITGSLNKHQERRTAPQISPIPGQSYDRDPSLSDHQTPAKMYAHHLKDMRPSPSDPGRSDSMRTKTMEDARSFHSSALGFDSR